MIKAKLVEIQIVMYLILKAINYYYYLVLLIWLSGGGVFCHLYKLDQMAPAWSTLSSSTWFEACTQWQFEQVFFFRELIWKELSAQW